MHLSTVVKYLMKIRRTLKNRTTPAVKLDIRTQTPLTRAEAVFALDALAAVNNLKFVLVGDDQVKVLPAALARRETNPVQ